MTADNEPGIPQVKPGPIRWLTPLLRDAVETKVAAHLGRSWTIRGEWDYSEFACHRCAIVSDSTFKVFFKFSEVAHAREQFGVELIGLRTLAEKAGALIPQPVGIVQIETGTLLLMAAVESVQRGHRQWREIGRALARIHQVRGTAYGFESDGFWGPLHQDNTLTSDWATFFRDRRLLPLLRTATDSGSLPCRVLSNAPWPGGRILLSLCENRQIRPNSHPHSNSCRKSCGWHTSLRCRTD